MWGQKKPIRKARGVQVTWKDGKKPTAPPAGARPKKWELRPVFKDPTVAASIKNRPRPAGYRQPPEVSDELEAAMVPGGSVVALHDLQVGEQGVYPYPALERFYGSPGRTVPVPKGSLLMYAGCIRAVERKYFAMGGYKDVNVFKHTFITPHGRCIIHDFTLIGPV